MHLATNYFHFCGHAKAYLENSLSFNFMFMAIFKSYKVLAVLTFKQRHKHKVEIQRNY